MRRAAGKLPDNIMNVVIGRVVGVHILDDVLTEDGRIDVNSIRPRSGTCTAWSARPAASNRPAEPPPPLPPRRQPAKTLGSQKGAAWIR